MPEITMIDKPVSRADLKKIAEQRFGDLVKAVVDLDKEIMAVGGELHADEEVFLLDKESKQTDLWGINIYPDLTMPNMLEFDSMINLRPSQNNRSRGVDDKDTREKIVVLVNKLVIQ